MSFSSINFFQPQFCNCSIFIIKWNDITNSGYCSKIKVFISFFQSANCLNNFKSNPSST